jgi:C4-type Zn-finger protein
MKKIEIVDKSFPEHVVRDYVETGGVACPFCGDEDRMGVRNANEYIETQLWMYWHCANCGGKWREVWQMKTIEPED